ncbi:NAD-dependent epimerase/dehydratase family protein [Thalassococcus sp. S3]|uniref:NAD-dependent epimerase/dehydratase family protein n=1 Tax=Thalassococcus sp. S3 TaxID=2017482 RepID=UPI001024028B|nr:NAD-dependent epimerase/dehydratase family protein [Thalassococcus sp. S3]QBF34190.1 UDP-glucuronate 5-epimerase [Thalassococcus sp. S3]
MKTALVTGAAGFIGYHCCARLLRDGWQVIGVDAMTDYYDVVLKRARLANLPDGPFELVEGRLETPGLLQDLFDRHRPDLVVHLAAQAGVRYSLDNPRVYLDTNVTGTFELLEAARWHPPAHTLLASSSSAYGAKTEMPYAETDRADHQMSFYAATKKATENLAHVYAHLHDLPITMFRFFTVYGPWGRPDMAPHKFTRAILSGEPIDIYNHGDMQRDFTYVDDLVHALSLLVDQIPGEGPTITGDSLSPVAPWRLVNIGNSAPVPLMEFIAAIEKATGRQAIRNMMQMQPGDVPATWADATLLQALTGYAPQTDLQTGIDRFVSWFRAYYGL